MTMYLYIHKLENYIKLWKTTKVS